MEITVKHIITLDNSIIKLLTEALNTTPMWGVKDENKANFEPKKDKSSGVAVGSNEEDVAEKIEEKPAKVPSYSREEVRALALKLKDKKGTPKVREVLSKFGVNSITDIEDDRINEVAKAIEEELNA